MNEAYIRIWESISRPREITQADGSIITNYSYEILPDQDETKIMPVLNGKSWIIPTFSRRFGLEVYNYEPLANVSLIQGSVDYIRTHLFYVEEEKGIRVFNNHDILPGNHIEFSNQRIDEETGIREASNIFIFRPLAQNLIKVAGKEIVNLKGGNKTDSASYGLKPGENIFGLDKVSKMRPSRYFPPTRPKKK